MGRRKQVLFVQGDSLAEEVDSDDEHSGGLHIGNVVVLRAPMSSSARTSSGLPRRGSRGSQAARGGATGNAAGRAKHSNVHYKKSQEEVLVTDSDASLDDELKDYLDNVKQADGNESDMEDASEEQQHTDTADVRAAATAAAGGGGRISRGSSWEDWDDGSSSRPGLGFHSAAAAARFADASLDRALEGMLARDLTQSGVDDTDSSGSSSSGYDSDTSSSDGTEAAAAAGLRTPLDIAASDNTTALVVDGAGQAMAVWDQLSLQHRFPVQTRQQQQHSSELQDARRTGSSSKKGESKMGGKDRRMPSRRNSGRQGSNSPAAAAGLMPPHMPSFACDATTAAVRAAYSAAAAAADVESEQRQQQRKQQKSVAKGANRGQLLPGEKKKLRKEKIAAKRAVRRQDRGQGALALLAAVEEFALSGGDMTLFPPCGKHKQAFTRSVAALFGIKASAQGGSSSGTTSLVLRSTGSTAPLDADSALQLQRLLVAELTREMVAAAIAEGPSPGARQRGTAGQRGDRADNSRSPSQGLHRQRSSTRAAAPEDSVFQQPVAFVSAGALDPNSSSMHPTRKQQQQPDSRETEAEQLCLKQGEAAAAAAAVPSVVGVASTGVAAAPAASCVQSLFLDDEINQQGHEHSKQPDTQQQQQQEPAEPAWVVDKQPWADVQQHVGLGFACTSAVAQAAAALGAPNVAAAAPGCTVAAAVAAAQAPAAPLYDRPAMNSGLGFGVSTVGLGFVQQQKKVAGDVEDLDMDSTPAAAAAAGQEQEARQHGTLELPGADSCSDGKRQLQELEDKFAALQASANPAATRRQQRRQQQQQERQQQRRQRQQRAEARLLAPNTALGPVVPAAAAAATVGFRVAGSDGEEDVVAAGGITLGMTKQQVKKAKKQQQRNARREARAAAAAEGDAEAMAAAAAEAAGNVSGGFAGFEAHTRGIGSRLMAGWGWREGEGLGRARQGRPEPLQATRRARNQGLGAE